MDEKKYKDNRLPSDDSGNMIHDNTSSPESTAKVDESPRPPEQEKNVNSAGEDAWQEYLAIKDRYKDLLRRLAE